MLIWTTMVHGIQKISFCRILSSLNPNNIYRSRVVEGPRLITSFVTWTMAPILDNFNVARNISISLGSLSHLQGGVQGPFLIAESVPFVGPHIGASLTAIRTVPSDNGHDDGNTNLDDYYKQLNAARDQGLSAETCCAEKEIY